MNVDWWAAFQGLIDVDPAQAGLQPDKAFVARGVQMSGAPLFASYSGEVRTESFVPLGRTYASAPPPPHTPHTLCQRMAVAEAATVHPPQPMSTHPGAKEWVERPPVFNAYEALLCVRGVLFACCPFCNPP